MAWAEAGRERLLSALGTYAGEYPEQGEVARCFAAFVHAHPRCCDRALAVGHLTTSSWVVDRQGTRTLLTHHRKLDRWLQPGGHVEDGDGDLATAALREASEETGLIGLAGEPEIFDLDRHWIPARRGEPGHWHYDVRFVVRAGDDEAFVVSDESHALAWVPVQDIESDRSYDESLRRMATRWLARQRT